VALSLVPRVCVFVACSKKFENFVLQQTSEFVTCITKFANFVLQATNAQGLGTRLRGPS